MSPTDWRRRWREGRIGFHRTDVHRFLIRFLPEVDRCLPENANGDRREILVPLCGKSVDLVWLRDQGYSATGVELVPEALEAFLEEHDLPATPDADPPFTSWRFPGLTLYNGDIFDLSTEGFDLVWDRAALIALPEETRARYAPHIVARLRPGGRILRVTLGYDPTAFEGPPYAVPEDEVRRLYRGSTIEELLVEERTVDERPAKLRELPWLRERVYRITV